MANAHTLQRKYNPCFKLLENSVLTLCKMQYRNWHYSSKKSRDLHRCHQKPRTGLIPDWKMNKLQNMSRNIYDHLKNKIRIQLFCIFVCWKSGPIKYAQIVRVNRPVTSCNDLCWTSGPTWMICPQRNPCCLLGIKYPKPVQSNLTFNTYLIQCNLFSRV